jgi:serine phosphatase RsbU (regulator of sigma subunit)
MERLFLVVAKRFQFDVRTSGDVEQVAGLADLFGFLYASPLALLGLVWLVSVTDLALVAREWAILATLLILALLFDRLCYFVSVDLKGVFVGAESSLSSVANWSAALLFGPTGLWLAAVGLFVSLVQRWRRTPTTQAHWSRLRMFTLREASAVLAGLIALALYERWGGAFPLSDLSSAAVLPALYAILLHLFITLLIYAPFVLYFGLRTVRLTEDRDPVTESYRSVWSFMSAASVELVLPTLAAPFAVLAAGLYVQYDLSIFLFFMGGLLFGGLLVRRLSQMAERSRQRSRELEQLERLSQAIISAPPDASTLPVLLHEHVPSMFPSSYIEIRRFPDRILMRSPAAEDALAVTTQLWDWVRTATRAHYFVRGAVPPWSGEPIREPLAVAPIVDGESVEAIGGLCLIPHRDAADVNRLLPAVQSLAAQISSALQSAQIYNQTLEMQKVEQELALAGQIQARFLPEVLPDIPGWQLAVTLEPARQTSGDFYDVIPLPNGRLGLLVADVADKGTGAALYMALSRTLIRTYAVEHHARPDFTLRVANNRILADTQVELFVTVFYAVLDPLTGRLTYCNAGHNPPFLYKTGEADAVQKLTRTGLPLGIFRGQTWGQGTVQLAPGDALILYTDGIVEAQNRDEQFFGEGRLLAVTQAKRGCAATEIRAAVLDRVHTFVGDAPRFDDLALMVLVREA